MQAKQRRADEKAREKERSKRPRVDPDAKKGILDYITVSKADESAARGKGSQQDSQVWASTASLLNECHVLL